MLPSAKVQAVNTSSPATLPKNSWALKISPAPPVPPPLLYYVNVPPHTHTLLIQIVYSPLTPSGNTPHNIIKL